MSLVTKTPGRWDHPFGPEWSEDDLCRVLELEPWAGMAAENRAKLEKLLRHESRVIERERGEVIVREGDYGHSAFFVVKGSVRVVLENSSLSPSELGKVTADRRGIWGALSQLWTNRREPEARDDPGELLDDSDGEGPSEDDYVPIILTDVDAVVSRHGTTLLGEGSLFGEIAALGRTPRTATLFADEDGTELLEIRWQGLRDLRKAFAEFRDHVDELFRERALRQYLRATPTFDGVGDTPLIRARIASGDLNELFIEALNFHAPSAETAELRLVDEDIALKVIGEVRDRSGELRISALSCDPGLTSPEARAQLTERAAEELGGQVIIVHRLSEDEQIWQWALSEVGEAKQSSVAMECSLRGASDPTELLHRLIRPLCLDVIAQQAELHSHGAFEWGRMGTRLEEEPVIATEGQYPNGVIMVRCGFARITRRVEGLERTISYLGPGRAYGLEELANNWRNPDSAVPLQRTLRALGYVDVVVIPTSVIEKFVLPSMSESALPELVEPAPLQGVSPLEVLKDKSGVDRGMVEFLVDHRFTNGTAAMVIDLDRCTRCDDCVRACATAHDDNPRFIRHGPVHDRFMIANACMHCADPVCMIGCPTGAISRESLGGQVVINDPNCIGCGTCSNNCPYENIRMVETRSTAGEMYVSQKGRPALKATKCDLCIDQLTGPACHLACPHDALERVDFNDLTEFAEWAQR